jgi:hypothetical protein
MTSKSKMEYVDWSMVYLYEEKHFNSNCFVVLQTDSVVKKLTNEKVVSERNQAKKIRLFLSQRVVDFVI